MGLLRRLAERFDPERRSRSSRDPYLSELFGGALSQAGQSVTPERATGVAAVHACVQLIAETVASLPLAPYRRLDNGDRQTDSAHPLYRVLHDRANAVQTAFEFREQLLASVLLTGNGYALKEIDGRGDVRSLVPLHPDSVRPERLINGRVRYVVAWPSGGSETFTQDEILHVPYRSRDGFTGLSPVTIARETLGVALAQQEFEGRFYSHGARPAGMLTSDALLGPEQKGAIREAWNQAMAGSRNAYSLLVLDGLKYQPIQMTNADAEFVESRKLNLEDIARIFRVPPPAIGILDKATYSNITEQSRWLISYCLRPWLVRLESSFNAQLLSEDGQQTHFLEHNADALLRGDTRERFEAYRIGREWGWLSVNEIRQRENLNAVSGGDAYLQPMNAQTVGGGRTA
jgi:HK97 family phage portal protein